MREREGPVQERLGRLREQNTRIVVGIELGGAVGRLGAAVVGVSGRGNDTFLDLLGFRSAVLPADLSQALGSLEKSGSFDSDELAGLDFLLYQHLSGLYEDTLDESGVEADRVDLIGMKEFEAGSGVFPQDPAVLSEMTGRIVACRFTIRTGGENGGTVPVAESLLERMVEGLIDRFDLDKETREAAAVALLANEALFHESSETCNGETGRRPRLKTVGKSAQEDDEACLQGEFYFPE